MDGNTDGNYGANSCTHTNADANSWWRVDLLRAQNVNSVRVFNRADCCGYRLTQFEVLVGNKQTMSENSIGSTKCGGTTATYSIPEGQNREIACDGLVGRYVFIVQRRADYLTLCEVQVFGEVRDC